MDNINFCEVISRIKKGECYQSVNGNECIVRINKTEEEIRLSIFDKNKTYSRVSCLGIRNETKFKKVS